MISLCLLATLALVLLINKEMKHSAKMKQEMETMKTVNNLTIKLLCSGYEKKLVEKESMNRLLSEFDYNHRNLIRELEKNLKMKESEFNEYLIDKYSYKEYRAIRCNDGKLRQILVDRVIEHPKIKE